MEANMPNTVALKPKPDRWQMLADIAYAMDGGRPGGGGTDFDYLRRSAPSVPNPPPRWSHSGLRRLCRPPAGERAEGPPVTARAPRRAERARGLADHVLLGLFGESFLRRPAPGHVRRGGRRDAF